MRSNNVTVDTVVVTQLDFDASTQWRKHFSENDLLVPHWFIAVLPHRSLALYAHTHAHNVSWVTGICRTGQ